MATQMWVAGRELRLASGDTAAAILPGAEAEAALRHALVEGDGRLRLVGAELRANRAKVALVAPEAECETTLRWRIERAVEAVNAAARRPLYDLPGDSRD